MVDHDRTFVKPFCRRAETWQLLDSLLVFPSIPLGLVVLGAVLLTPEWHRQTDRLSRTGYDNRGHRVRDQLLRHV